MDVACYSVVFYHIGVLLRKHEILAKVKNSNVMYFILSPLWVYMIYAGSMEIAIRNYGDYGVVIGGAVCGVLLIYKAATYIYVEWPLISTFLREAGKESITILFIHSLLSGEIKKIIGIRFNNDHIIAVFLCILIQVVLGIIMGVLCSRVKKIFKLGKVA